MTQISNMERWGVMVQAIAKILKTRFPNLTTEETLSISIEVLKVAVQTLKGDTLLEIQEAPGEPLGTH